jgi:dihydroorotase
VGGHTAQGGTLEAGDAANLCVVDLETTTTVTASSLASRSKNSPYLGRTLPVSVRHTVLRGIPTVRDGVAIR